MRDREDSRNLPFYVRSEILKNRKEMLWEMRILVRNWESKKKPSNEVDFLPSNDLANDKTYKRVLRQTHVDKYKLKVVREEKKVVREELLNEKIKAEIDEIRSRIPSKSP